MIRNHLFISLFSLCSFVYCTEPGHLTTLSNESQWKIGGKIHFEEQSSALYMGTIEVNEIIREEIKKTFSVTEDSCAHNAKPLLKKTNEEFFIRHYEERSRPGIGEEMHATLLYTTRRFNEHETLLDIYDNLVQIDETLPRTQPPTVEQVANAYQKILSPDLMFNISTVKFIQGQTGNAITATLMFQGKNEITNKYGNPVSGKFLHMTLVNVDQSVIPELEKISLLTINLNKRLSGKWLAIGHKNGKADLEFGLSGSAQRVRPL